jgi:transaldolase
MPDVQTEHTPLETIEPDSAQANRIAEFVHDRVGSDSPPRASESSEFWRRINPTETSLWLDSGDVDEIDSLWVDEFSGLTTNNTLLNRAVQDGIYDQLVPQANKLVDQLPDDARVREISFILNVCHALRLAQRFGCDMSVELHTDVAHDTEATVAFARRCHAIDPDRFIVKVPLTPAGLVAIGQLRDMGIRVNCTLGFSARQNYVATALARPSFVNVFLGRLNSYIADNELGDGDLAGEKTVLASQAEVATFTRGLPRTDTRQIAASVRAAPQLPRLAGVDVITMPTSVAQQAEQALDRPWQSQLNEELTVKLGDDVDPESVRIEKLWEVSKVERYFVQKAILSPPDSAVKLKQMATDHDVGDLFPEIGEDEWQALSDEGKVPRHDRWQDRITAGDLAIDSLMTMAGLAAFSASQAELDQRIRQFS